MKTKSILLVVSCFAGALAIHPRIMAEPPTSKPVIPAVPSNPPREELKSPDLSKPKDDELQSLIQELTKKMKPAANALPSRTKSGFVEDEEFILRLAAEVLLLRERVEKLEHK